MSCIACAFERHNRATTTETSSWGKNLSKRERGEGREGRGERGEAKKRVIPSKNRERMSDHRPDSEAIQKPPNGYRIRRRDRGALRVGAQRYARGRGWLLEGGLRDT